jgi:hypothetical protein
LELLARAADALGLPAVAATFRAHGSRPEDIPDENWAEYVEAVATRTRQMERELRERDRGYRLRPDPVAVLRDILTQSRHSASGHRCRPCHKHIRDLEKATPRAGPIFDSVRLADPGCRIFEPFCQSRPMPGINLSVFDFEEVEQCCVEINLCASFDSPSAVLGAP